MSTQTLVSLGSLALVGAVYGAAILSQYVLYQEAAESAFKTLQDDIAAQARYKREHVISLMGI